MNSRAAKNLAHRLARGVRDVTDSITQPRKAAKLDQQIKAVQLNRQTKHVRPDVTTPMGRKIITARGVTAGLKYQANKRKAAR